MPTKPKDVEVHSNVKRIVSALGLDPNKVREICIRFAADEIVTASVLMFVEPEGILELERITKKYRLVPIEDETIWDQVAPQGKEVVK